MGVYISKPIRSEVLKPELGQFPSNGKAPSKMTPVAPTDEGTFNLNTLLERVDNDRELLRELLEIFKEEFPRYREELRRAAALSDLPRLRTVGHALKGMFSNLAADRAAEQAANLERLGKGSETAGLAAALEAFEAEAAALLPMLDSYLAEARR
jgi:HPt (histidine-containing phosphotransfer) domain-containing protein